MRNTKVKRKMKWATMSFMGKHEDVLYEKKIRRQIKEGTLPRYHVIVDNEGKLPKKTSGRVEYNPTTKEWTPKLKGHEYKIVSTLSTLIKK